MSAMDTVMAPFEIACDLFVLTVVLAVAHRPHVLEIDPRPHDVDMLSAELLVHHHDTRMIGEAEPLFESVDCLRALLGGEAVRRLDADGRMIERFLAVRAGGKRPSQARHPANAGRRIKVKLCSRKWSKQESILAKTGDHSRRHGGDRYADIGRNKSLCENGSTRHAIQKALESRSIADRIRNMKILLSNDPS